jgi:hypothetical protein
LHGCSSMYPSTASTTDAEVSKVRYHQRAASWLSQTEHRSHLVHIQSSAWC